MKTNALRPLLLGTCILALWGTAACGANTQKAASSAEESADADDDPATGAAEAPAAAPMPAEQASPPAEPARDAGEGYPRAPTVESNAAPARKEKKLISETEPNDDLRAATSAFDESLGAKELSCEGARPHRDAICEIAKRLCELSVKTPSSGERDDCVTANRACEKAQRKYQARCGK